jgi:hypothetical protein
MKKIKKAAVLVPAFATVVLATVGSVTGTMAWFTANRTATTTASVFESTALETSLAIAASEPFGVSVDAHDSSIVTMAPTDKLTHGSYDAINDQLSVVDYSNTQYIDETGIRKDAMLFNSVTHKGAYGDAAKNWTASESAGKTFYAVRWTYTFTYTFAGLHQNNVALMLDCKDSHFGVTKPDGGAAALTSTGNGFRLGFREVGASGTPKIHVLGKDENHKTDAKEGNFTGDPSVVYTPAIYTGGYYVKYKSGEGVTDNTVPNAASENKHLAYSDLDNVGSYGDAYEQISNDKGILEGNQAESVYSTDNKINYFGTLTAPTEGENLTASVSYNVVAWFEGMDEYVKANNEMAKVSAGLKFYVADIAK